MDRKSLVDMSDRELLEEMTANLRVLADAIQAIGQNPMAAAFMGSKR